MIKFSKVLLRTKMKSVLCQPVTLIGYLKEVEVSLRKCTCHVYVTSDQKFYFKTIYSDRPCTPSFWFRLTRLLKEVFFKLGQSFAQSWNIFGRSYLIVFRLKIIINKSANVVTSSSTPVTAHILQTRWVGRESSKLLYPSGKF